MKIVLSGASATGKTTLLDGLSLRLSLNILNIPTSRYLTKYNLQTQDELVEMGIKEPRLTEQLYSEMITERCNLIQYNDNFITDRSPVDSLMYYMLQHMYFNQGSDDFLNRHKQLCIDILNKNVYIIILPINNSFELNNGIRTLNTGFNNYYQQSLIHLYNDLNIPYFYLKELPLGINERIEFITNGFIK